MVVFPARAKQMFVPGFTGTSGVSTKPQLIQSFSGSLILWRSPQQNVIMTNYPPNSAINLGELKKKMDIFELVFALLTYTHMVDFPYSIV